MRPSLLLSHHRGPGLERCFRIGAIRLCARCSGLWPALVLGMALQRLWLPPPGRLSVAVDLGLLWPGLWDFARGLRRPDLGTNLGRFGIGALAGLGLSRAAVAGRVFGFASPDALLPLLFCFCWVISAGRLWPEAVPGDSAT
ncbi:MAG: hypothetical protein ACYCWW_20200 [Deltaproteobacteria bacterium]